MVSVLNYKQINLIQRNTEPLTSVKYSPNGAFLASTSADATAHIYSFDGKFIRSFCEHSKGINDIAWSPDSQYFVTASDDKSLFVWDVETGKVVHVLYGHTNNVYSCTFDRTSGSLIVSGSSDELVKVWDVRVPVAVRSLTSHSDAVTTTDFNHDSTCIMTGSHDCLVRIWDTATGTCLKTIFAEGNPPVSYAKYTPNSQYILVGTLDSTIRMWTVGSTSSPTRCLKLYHGHTNRAYSTTSDISLPHGPKVVTGSEDGQVLIWDMNSRQLLQVLHGHKRVVMSVSAHPTRQMIASASLDATLRIWEHTSPYMNGHTHYNSTSNGFVPEVKSESTC